MQRQRTIRLRTVFVACRIPRGLNIGGGHIVNGPPSHTGNPLAPEDYSHLNLMRNQYRVQFAITRNFPKHVWDDWFKVNTQSDMVMRGMILAHEDWSELLTLVHAVQNDHLSDHMRGATNYGVFR